MKYPNVVRNGNGLFDLLSSWIIHFPFTFHSLSVNFKGIHLVKWNFPLGPVYLYKYHLNKPKVKGFRLLIVNNLVR